MDAPPSPTPRRPSRLAWALDAAVAAGSLTTGALLVFGRARDGALTAFSRVGRAAGGGDPLASTGLEAGLGLLVHLGQMTALGAATALLMGAGRVGTRLRAALLVVLAWELAPRVLPWLLPLRVDVAAGLTTPPRLGLAAVLVMALALAPRRG